MLTFSMSHKTKLHLSNSLPVILVMITSLFLYGCISSGGYNNTQPWTHKNSNNAQNTAEQEPNNLSVASVEQQRLNTQESNLTPVKVAILLPLSGQHKKLGQAMLNAAQMAVFDIAHNNFELLPKDTLGTPKGARQAAKSALQDGAQLILGPVFSSSVSAARQVTQSAGINLIAFSTDWRLANKNTFLISFLPFDQIERIVNYAARAGYTRIGVISPKDNYGNAVTSAYKAISQRSGVSTSRIEHFEPPGRDLGNIIRKFSDYDARKASKNKYGAPFDAVLMPVGGSTARQIGSFLSHYDLPPRTVKRLGTGLMDDQTLASDKSLDGTWFAAPDPYTRQKFKRRYHNIYYSKPPRISSLAYDATALAAILARTGINKNNRPAFDHNSITNPNGFAGVDGIFRFRPNGIVERGLSVLEYKRGTIVVIDKAPTTFKKNLF